MAGVNQHEQHHQIGRQVDVVAYDLLEFLFLVAGHFGVAIARQIDQIPTSVDEKMIDKAGFSGFGRGESEPFTLAQHIDKRGFTHIRPSDEGEFREDLFGSLRNTCAASCK